MNRADTLTELGEAEDLQGDADQALEILRRLVAAGNDKLRDDLANALRIRAKVLASLGRWRDAPTCYDESVGLWENLDRTESSEEKERLADTLRPRALARHTLGMGEDAQADLRQATALLHSLVLPEHAPGPARLALHIARTHVAVLRDLGRWNDLAALIADAEQWIDRLKFETAPTTDDAQPAWQQERQMLLALIGTLPKEARYALKAAQGFGAMVEAQRSPEA